MLCYHSTITLLQPQPQGDMNFYVDSLPQKPTKTNEFSKVEGYKKTKNNEYFIKEIMTTLLAIP